LETKSAHATLDFVSDPKRLLEDLRLPAEERAALAGALIESLDLEVDEVEAAWSVEIGRRLERVDAGVAKTIPWSEARRRILAAAGRASNA
jgi:putative addiction module component (TIGR02574 family)